MRRDIKKKILFGVVVLVTVWPAVHHLAVARYELNPWMFFGLSMYTQPRPIVKVVDVRIGMGRRGPLRTVDRDVLGPNPEGKAERLEYLTGKLALDRLAYGTLRSPDGALKELFDLFPRARRLRVEIEVAAMNAEARMAPRRIRYECSRSAEAGAECSIEGDGSEALT